MDEEIKTTENTELDQCFKVGQTYLDNWKRAEADLANYKKDEQKRIADILKFGNEAILMQAINVMDNLERALQHTPSSAADKPEVTEKISEWLKGIEQTVKQFQELLTKYKVERIKSVGEKFDPLYHEAISGPRYAEGSSEASEGEIVSQELQSGYILEGKVIRPARVVLK